MPILIFFSGCGDRGGRPAEGEIVPGQKPGGPSIDLPACLPKKWEPAPLAGPTFEISIDRNGQVSGQIEEAKKFLKSYDNAPRGARLEMAYPTVVLSADRALAMKTLIEKVWNEVVVWEGAVKFRCKEERDYTIRTMAWDEGAQEGEGLLRYRVDIGPRAVRISVERSPLDLNAKPGDGTWPIKSHQEGIKKVKEWMESHGGTVEYTIDMHLPPESSVEETIANVHALLGEMDGAMGAGFKIDERGGILAQIFVGKIARDGGRK